MCRRPAPTLLVTDDADGAGRGASSARRRWTTPAEDRARRSRRRSRRPAPKARCSSSTPTCRVSVPRDLRTLAGSRRARRARPRGGRGRHDERARPPARLVLRAALRPRQRRPLPGSRRGERRGVVAAAIPNLADDVDTLDDLERLELRVGPRTQAALRRWSHAAMKVALLSGGVGGARFARGLVEAVGAGRRDGRRQRRRRPRGARPVGLARPRQHPLRARGPATTRSAAGVAPARRGTRSRR